VQAADEESMKSLLASALLIATAAVAVYAQNPMRSGQWEVSMQMQMPGMTMPEMKNNTCVTPEQLQRDPASGLPNGARGNANDACKVSDYKVVGNTVTWKMACTGAQTMNGEGELMFTGDTYTGNIKMMMPQGAMTMKMTGKRLGDCTK
jgi:hypothetical protein